MQLLREEYGVDTVVANPPVHSTNPFFRNRTAHISLPVSEEVAKRLFCVPIHPCMSEEDNVYMCAALWEAVETLRN